MYVRKLMTTGVRVRERTRAITSMFKLVVLKRET